MTVKEVVMLAAKNVGRDDLAALLSSGAAAGSGEQAEIESLVRCYNLVENEIALDYFPLRAAETLTVTRSMIPFSAFAHAPVHIEKAVTGGRIARFSLFPDGIFMTDLEKGKAEITYSYAPEQKQLGDPCEVPAKISARLLSFGVAGEFCLTSGETGRATMWQSRYQDALRANNLLRKTLRIRSRRWE